MLLYNVLVDIRILFTKRALAADLRKWTGIIAKAVIVMMGQIALLAYLLLAL